MRRRSTQVRRIATALLRRELSPERPIVILSGNDIEHALLGLAAMYVGIPYAPISPPYSLISSDFGKLKHILDLLTPGLVFAADGEAFARAIERRCRPTLEVVVTRNPSAAPADDAVRRTRRHAARSGGGRRACRGRARHHRQDPVHLRLDRHAEGRDQHPAHVVLEPGDAAHLARLLSGRAAGDRRLGAVAPHRRRQPRRRPRADERRHDLYRRRQAAARPDRRDRAQPARDRADLVLHRAEGLRGAAPLFSAPTTSCAATSSAASRCCGSRARRWRSRCSTR